MKVIKMKRGDVLEIGDSATGIAKIHFRHFAEVVVDALPAIRIHRVAGEVWNCQAQPRVCGEKLLDKSSRNRSR